MEFLDMEKFTSILCLFVVCITVALLSTQKPPPSTPTMYTIVIRSAIRALYLCILASTALGMSSLSKPKTPQYTDEPDPGTWPAPQRALAEQCLVVTLTQSPIAFPPHQSTQLFMPPRRPVRPL
jgi:hypothetical protein